MENTQNFNKDQKPMNPSQPVESPQDGTRKGMKAGGQSDVHEKGQGQTTGGERNPDGTRKSTTRNDQDKDGKQIHE